MREEATLYILSGLPGSGKTSISRLVARHLGCAYLRIDTIEQGLRDLCSVDVEGEGYRLAYRIAADNLRLGTSVVADSCNPLELTRREWENVARDVGVRYVNIEVLCSDSREHRRRVDSREQDIAGLKLPTWDEVEKRTYDAWTVDRIVVDTAAKSVEDCVEELLSGLALL
jgi:predicted kinase